MTFTTFLFALALLALAVMCGLLGGWFVGWIIRRVSRKQHKGAPC